MSGQVMYEPEKKHNGKVFHGFDLESLSADPHVVITYSIKDIDIAKLYSTSTEFREIMGSGYYCLLDDHICLYTPELISSGDGPNTIAVSNKISSSPEQCCLAFVYRIPESDPQRTVRGRYSSPRLRSEAEKLKYASMIFVHPEYLQTLQEKGINPMDFYKELQDTLPRTFIGGGQEPPPDPPRNPLEDLIKQMISIRHTSLKKLSDELKISEETIERFWTKPNARPKLENVIAVCIGLHMPPTTSDLIISLSGYNLRNVPQERGYRALINGYYKHQITTCNHLLLVSGLEAMTPAT